MQQQKTILVFRDLKLFPSLNVMLREHFSKRKKRKEKLEWLIKSQTKDKHKGMVEIRFIRYATLLQDWDNHCSSFKIVGDALVSCGVIEDDKPTIIRPFLPDQEKVKTKQEEKIIIVIKNLANN